MTDILSDFGPTVAWFAAASSLVGLVFLLIGARKNRVSERLDGISGPESAAPRPVATPGTPGLSGRKGPTVVAVDNPMQQLLDRQMRRQEKKRGMKERLEQAGLYDKRAIGIFVVLRVFLLLVPVGIGAAAGYLGTVTMSQGMMFGALAGVAGTIAPSFFLDHIKRGRQTKIRRALPDALDVLVVCLQGGLSLTGSFSRVAHELVTAHPMLALEFQIIERQTHMGRTTGEAVREFANRFDLEELRSMASVIVQAEKIGSSVVVALEIFAETLRQKRSQYAEEMAQKASIKMLFPTCFCIFPAMFVVLLGPAAISIWEVLIQGTFKQ